MATSVDRWLWQHTINSWADSYAHRVRWSNVITNYNLWENEIAFANVSAALLLLLLFILYVYAFVCFIQRTGAAAGAFIQYRIYCETDQFINSAIISITFINLILYHKFSNQFFMFSARKFASNAWRE